MNFRIDHEKFLQGLEALPQNRFVAMLDIMGFKKIVENEATSEVAAIFRQIYDRIKEKRYTDNLHITHFSDTILIVSKDDSVESFEGVVNTAASFENMMIAKGYAINGCISHGGVTTESGNLFGEPLANAHIQQEELFFYGITLDEKAEKKYEELARQHVLFSNGYGPFSTPDMIVWMKVPTKKNGWTDKYVVNWMDVFSMEINASNKPLTYDEQIPIIRKYMENLYEKYIYNTLASCRANMYILNTELVLREWYNFTGNKNGVSKWGEPLFDRYLIKIDD